MPNGKNRTGDSGRRTEIKKRQTCRQSRILHANLDGDRPRLPAVHMENRAIA